MVYDPTLTRVAYTAGKEPDLSLVLWDLESKRELWRLTKHSTVFIQPEWSPDGTHLAAVALNDYEDNWDRFELYLVSRDGQATQWIDLRGYYVNSSVTLKWSPDGRYVAIVPVGSAKTVLILDIASQQLVDYCISANAFADGYQAQIVWSPDSTQVIVPNQDTSAIVIDLKRKSAAYIVQDKDYKPVGWLIVSP